MGMVWETPFSAINTRTYLLEKISNGTNLLGKKKLKISINATTRQRILSHTNYDSVSSPSPPFSSAMES